MSNNAASARGGCIHLVQLLIPVYDNGGRPFPASHYAELRAELTSQFGGMTAYTRSPAQGIWATDGAPAQRDDIVVYEVMAEVLGREWWIDYRRRLERRFAQDELVIRAQLVERL